MKKKYIIKDWAGNVIDFYGEHDTFQDAWEAVQSNFDHITDDKKYDETISEFYVDTNE